MIEQSSFLGVSLRTQGQRRLLVVLYYSLLMVMVAYGFRHSKALPYALVTQTIVFGGLLGGIRAGGPVKPYGEPLVPLTNDDPNGVPLTLNLNGRSPRAWGPLPWSPLDEREREQRDRAHYTAFRILRWATVFAAVAYWVGMNRAAGWLTQQSPLLLWLLVVVTLSLPQSVLLWTEPVQPTGELVELPNARSC